MITVNLTVEEAYVITNILRVISETNNAVTKEAYRKILRELTKN